MIRRVNIWQEIDWITVLLYGLLVIFGLVNIYAAVYDDRHQSIMDLSMRYGKQAIWILAALILAMIVIMVDTKFFTFFAYFIYVLTLLLLLLVAFFGKEVNGARSWFSLGGLQVQPTEFAKIGTCLALAKYMNVHSIKLKTFWTMLRSVLPMAVIIGLPMGLIGLQPDMGSALVYVALVFVLYREGLPGIYLFCGFLFGAVFVFSLLWSETPQYMIMMIFYFFVLSLAFLNRKIVEVLAALIVYYVFLIAINLWNKYTSFDASPYFKHLFCLGASVTTVACMSFFKKILHIWWVIGLLIVYVGFGYGVTYFFDHGLEKHQRDRIEIFLGKKYDPKKVGYNIEQSKIAIGSGGFAGKGFLQGTQTKYNFVPEQSTDFIFCTVGEEWGFLGSSVILALFLAFLLRLLALCERQRSTFSRIYGYGVVSVFFIHVAINAGMTMGLFPVVGIPLPFFSYGGSSLWAFTILLFIFLRFDASRMELLR